MIQYHGTPITPKAELYSMKGRHFCVSFANPGDADDVLAIGQSVMWDNGAFSFHTNERPTDWPGFYRWLEPRLGHPHWAVVPDVINGSVEQQRDLRAQWPFPRDRSSAVWHVDKPFSYLCELVDAGYAKLSFGSAGEFWQVGSEAWRRRVSEAFDCLALTFGQIPWVHMLRGLKMRGQEFPFASADSCNVGVNYKRNYAPNPRGCAEVMAREIDSTQAPLSWRI